ncbi:hypothetical protein [Halorubrum cibi]|uniref:hypothetical protein n=1 Tax=Halorubrum cibi TaxID=413815 RepID=UPI00163D7512|nr:hypothetical protein [Halorubrum cibi]
MKDADGVDQVSCPHERCGNENLDRVEDDPENDFFCHWCGGLFDTAEVLDGD